MKLLNKTLGKVIVGFFVVIALAIAAVYGVSSSRMNKQYDVAATPLTVPSDADSISEGHRLYVSRGCIDCHGDDLSGRVIMDNPAIGKLTGANLTAGKGGAASTMSDGDLARAIRNGVGANGRALIFMPATDYKGMSDEDAGKIIAYIRSASPVDKASPSQQVGPMARVLFVAGKLPLLVTAELVDHQAKAPAQVAVAETVEYGRYIAQMCTGCHGVELTGGPIPGGAPDWPPAKNITAAGIGQWSESDFITAIRTGVRPDGSAIKPPMPWKNLSAMTDVELKALWLYLKTV